jgi:hypothetical protein
VRCESKDPTHSLSKVEEIVTALTSHSLTPKGQFEVVSFNEPISPKLSRVDIVKKGKETTYTITVSIRKAFPGESAFWTRIRLVTEIYDQLAHFATAYEDSKGVDIILEEARLEQQKDEPDGHRSFRK